MAGFKTPRKRYAKPYTANHSFSQPNPKRSVRSSPQRHVPSTVPQALEKAQSQRKKRVSLDLRSRAPPAHSPIRPGSTTQSSPSTVRGDSVPIAHGGFDALEDVGEDDADALSEIIMAVDMRDRGTVGCCYYVAREETLYFMDDVKNGGVDIIDTCTSRCRRCS